MASGIDDVLFPFLENLRTTPTYIIHGAQDQVMPVEDVYKRQAKKSATHAPVKKRPAAKRVVRRPKRTKR